jgi:hypothetical protein
VSVLLICCSPSSFAFPSHTSRRFLHTRLGDVAAGYMDSWGGWGPGRGERGPGGEDRARGGGGGGGAQGAVRVRLCLKTRLLLTSALCSMLAAADAHHEDLGDAHHDREPAYVEESASVGPLWLCRFPHVGWLCTAMSASPLFMDSRLPSNCVALPYFIGLYK